VVEVPVPIMAICPHELPVHRNNAIKKSNSFFIKLILDYYQYLVDRFKI
jgi:hypothetical protein